MKKTLIFILPVFLILVSSCAKIYYSPETYEMAQKHEIVAIVPPIVTIQKYKSVDEETMRKQEAVESLNFQIEMQNWLLRRKMQKSFKVDVLDVETTNIELERAGYFDGVRMTPKEISELLNVDAIITSNYYLEKPLSEGAAIALGIIFDIWGTTNKTKVDIGIYDSANEKLIWTYNHKLSGSVGSSAYEMVDELMRHASKKMPYKKQ